MIDRMKIEGKHNYKAKKKTEGKWLKNSREMQKNRFE